MAREKRGTVTLKPNMEYSEGRSKPYRVRFRVSGVKHDFGYYEKHDEALIIRNFVADQLGQDRIDEEYFNKLPDEMFDAVLDAHQDIMDKAEKLQVKEKQRPKKRVNTADLQSQIDELRVRLEALENR